MKSLSNLPPGVTDAMIDAQAGVGIYYYELTVDKNGQETREEFIAVERANFHFDTAVKDPNVFSATLMRRNELEEDDNAILRSFERV
jgi:hypothetical protein